MPQPSRFAALLVCRLLVAPHAVAAGLSEFQVMTALSPAFHIVEAFISEAGTQLVCRDLRTRPLGTTFGDLEIALDGEDKVVGVCLHV